jgi:hypothetical protein
MWSFLDVLVLFCDLTDEEIACKSGSFKILYACLKLIIQLLISSYYRRLWSSIQFRQQGSLIKSC